MLPPEINAFYSYNCCNTNIVVDMLRREIEGLGIEVEHSAAVVRLLRGKVERERDLVSAVDREMDEFARGRNIEASEAYNQRVEAVSAQLNEV